jgi:DNA-binding NarL/FixJ family response regulator
MVKMAALEPSKHKDYGLTKRQKQILRYIAEGREDHQIARKMCVSHNTILYHTKNIHDKLRVHSRRELIVKALRERLI